MGFACSANAVIFNIVTKESDNWIVI